MKLSTFPHLVKEWHPTKNGVLTPEDFTHGSKKKVWWLCPQGHSYEAKPNSRTAGKTGCPYCSGRIASSDNNLLANFPDIAKEWHPTKNGELTPEDVTFGSSKKIWWLCSNAHSFFSTVNRRTSMMTNCPYCQGRKAGEDNNLSTVFPELAKEWHPTKNGELKPENYTRGSNKKVWWLCPKDHSYETTIKIRTIQQSSCPYCSRQSSEQELRILSELRWVFNEVNSRHKVDGKEVDIFLPELNIGIEFDGSYWHKDKIEADLEKNKHLLTRGIQLIRVRQHPLKALSKNDIVVSNKQLIKGDVNKILNTIDLLVEDGNLHKINEYLNKPSFVNERIFREYISYFPMPLPEHSLAILFPLVSSEWNYEKNHPLTPNDFTYGSVNKAWWLCPKGHSYKAIIGNRTVHQTGCPFCSGRKAGSDNSLLAIFPKIAKEWHPAKNGNLQPSDFTRASDKKVWWLCPKGHSYSSAVRSRTLNNTGCPYCAGKKASDENNLLKLFPEVAKEWHPIKNNRLSPDKVVSKSSKKAWFLCPKGHSYKAKIGNRTVHQTGCPFCSGNKVGEDNNLQAKAPEIAKEWHPTKNNELTPRNFTFGSGVKVWWLCPKNHSYEATISNRTGNQSGCPYCSGLKTLNYDLFK